MSKTNDTTRDILEFLIRNKIFAWRQNVSPIPTRRDGVITGFRSGGKAGVSDIVAIYPPNGRAIFIEVKTGSDRQRPEQKGFQRNVELMGAVYIIVKTYADFLEQWEWLSQSI